MQKTSLFIESLHKNAFSEHNLVRDPAFVRMDEMRQALLCKMFYFVKWPFIVNRMYVLIFCVTFWDRGGCCIKTCVFILGHIYGPVN